jgi:predicted PurR-regulated permease PerM
MAAPVTEPVTPARSQVPWRTIWATIFAVGATYVGYQFFLSVTRIVTWLVVAIFFTIVLTPPVDFLQRKAHMRRGIATAVVFIVGLALFAGMLYAFIRPLVTESSAFADALPSYVEEARQGKGPVGDIVRRYNLEQKVQENQAKIQQALTDLGAPALDLARSVFNTLLALLTIIVLTILMLLQGPNITQTALALIPDDRRERVRRVSVDACRAVSGYIFGNLLISVIAGVATWIVLLILGVPYAGVLGLFVAFADLIPLVGATLGAVPTILFAFLHGVPAGIITLIFFIVYQQFENHVLQVAIMSRTVNVNPLTVLISVLIGVELFGFLGALLAIPVAGILQVVVRDIYDERYGHLRREPVIGADEVPMTQGE